MLAPLGLPFNVVMQHHICLLVSSVQRVTECSMLNAGLPFIVVMQYYLVTGQLCVTHD
jgi:hypothetical protein